MAPAKAHVRAHINWDGTIDIALFCRLPLGWLVGPAGSPLTPTKDVAVTMVMPLELDVVNVVVISMDEQELEGAVLEFDGIVKGFDEPVVVPESASQS